MRLLITGFDPFGKDLYNPSYQAIKQLDNQIDNIEIVKLQLPTKFEKASEVLIEALNEALFDYVILTGQAAGREHITLEKFALNIEDSRKNDNEGYQPYDETIIEHGALIFQTHFDVRSLSKFLTKKSIDNSISYYAGTFVCNSTYYKLLHYIETNQLNTKALFVHVPVTKDQLVHYDKKIPYASLQSIIEGLQSIIEYVSLQHKKER